MPVSATKTKQMINSGKGSICADFYISCLIIRLGFHDQGEEIV